MAVLNYYNFDTLGYDTTESPNEFYSGPQTAPGYEDDHIRLSTDNPLIGTNCLRVEIVDGLYRNSYPLCRSEVRTQVFGGYPNVMQGWRSFSFRAGTLTTGEEDGVIHQLWDGDNPTHSIRWYYDTNQVISRLHDGPGSDPNVNHNLFIASAEWTHVDIYYKARPDSSGILKIWINGVLTVDYQGRTSYATEMNSTTPYPKLGIYSASFGEGNLPNRVAYFDAVSFHDDSDSEADTLAWINNFRSPEPENPYYPERTVPDDKHPISIDNQIFFCPANAVPGDQLGEVYFLYTFCRFWNEANGTNLTEDQFTFTKVGGPSNFIVNSDTGMISVDNLVGFTEDTTITVRVAIGGMHMDVTCNILYIPMEDCVYFDSTYAGGDSNGTREKPYLKFESGTLGTGTAGKTYLYKRGTTTTNQSAMFINPKVGGEYPRFMNICAWGQGSRPIFTDTGAGEGNRTFTLGGQPWGNNPPDPALAGHNIRLFDIETYRGTASDWYPILIKPVGDNIRMGRFKGSNTLYDHGIVYLPAMTNDVQGAEDRNIVLENFELYNAVDRAIKVETSGVKCYNFRCKNDSSLGVTGSPAPTCAHKPHVHFYYIDVEVADINSGNLGFQARASDVVHKWVVAKGLRNVITPYVHDANDGDGGEYLIDNTCIFDRFIIEDSYQACYFGRSSGTTDVIDGVQIKNIKLINVQRGIEVSGGAQNILTAYCDLSGCTGGDGFKVWAGTEAAGTGNKLHNCTLFDNASQDIELQRDGVEIVNCNYGVIAGAANATITTSSNSRLQVDLVGAGTDLGYEFDLHGNPVANPPSIGAIEYTEVVVPTYDITASGTNGTITGTGTYNQGDPVSLQANPDPTFRFVKWVEVENEYTDNPYNFTATADREFTAVFEKITHNITASGDHVTITGDGIYDEGSTAELLAVPDEGYEFVKWTDGDEEFTDNPYSFTVVDERNLIAVTKQEDPPEPSVITVRGRFKII